MRPFTVALATGCLVAALGAQEPAPPQADPGATRLTDRIQALQNEAQRLAGQSKTLLTELRTLEVERDLRIEESRLASAAVATAEQTLRQTAQRLAALEAQRVAQLPDLKRQFAELYKRGHTGYAQALFGASSVTELARATRAVAALDTLNQRRVEDHRRTVE